LVESQEKKDEQKDESKDEKKDEQKQLQNLDTIHIPMWQLEEVFEVPWELEEFAD